MWVSLRDRFRKASVSRWKILRNKYSGVVGESFVEGLKKRFGRSAEVKI